MTVLEKYKRKKELMEFIGTNYSDVYVPEIRDGRVMMHDHLLYHGISPVRHGTKYTLIIFWQEMDEVVRACIEVAAKDHGRKTFYNYLKKDCFFQDGE
jgi:hypothetical protein